VSSNSSRTLDGMPEARVAKTDDQGTRRPSDPRTRALFRELRSYEVAVILKRAVGAGGGGRTGKGQSPSGRSAARSHCRDGGSRYRADRHLGGQGIDIGNDARLQCWKVRTFATFCSILCHSVRKLFHFVIMLYHSAAQEFARTGIARRTSIDNLSRRRQAAVAWFRVSAVSSTAQAPRNTPGRNLEARKEKHPEESRA